MIRHFAVDGSVKREWPEGLHVTVFERDGKSVATVQGSNAVVGDVELAAGEQVGESFASVEVLKRADPQDVIAPGKLSREQLQAILDNPDIIRQLEGTGEKVDYDALQKVLETASEDLGKRAALTAATLDQNHVDALANSPAAAEPAPAEAQPANEVQFHSTLQGAIEAFHASNGTTPPPEEAQPSAGPDHGDTIAQAVNQPEPAAVSAEPVAEIGIPAAEVAALNDAIHIVQDVAAHLTHPHPTETHAEPSATSATSDTHADPAAPAPETPQQ